MRIIGASPTVAFFVLASTLAVAQTGQKSSQDRQAILQLSAHAAACEPADHRDGRDDEVSRLAAGFQGPDAREVDEADSCGTARASGEEIRRRWQSSSRTA